MDARRFNETCAVTGALLFGGGEFFQYFEGPPSAVQAVYKRVKRSALHHQIREKMNETVAARRFKTWHMAFAEPSTTVLQQIANEHWAMVMPHLRGHHQGSPGLGLLLEFWGDHAATSSD